MRVRQSTPVGFAPSCGFLRRRRRRFLGAGCPLASALGGGASAFAIRAWTSLRARDRPPSLREPRCGSRPRERRMTARGFTSKVSSGNS